jgi:hypothetical protein
MDPISSGLQLHRRDSPIASFRTLDGAVEATLAGTRKAVGPGTLISVPGALQHTRLHTPNSLHSFDSHAPRLLETAVLVLATVATAVTRYVALAMWVFRPWSTRPCEHAIGDRRQHGAYR